MSTLPIRVILVDDQTLLREGLAVLLGMMPSLQVVGSAGDAAAALELAANTQPNVALVDVRMPGMNGIGLTHALRTRHPNLRVIMLTTFDDDGYVFEALKAGASGYLLKTADPEQLANAIRRVHAGEAVLDPAVTQKVIHRAVTGAETSPPVLQERLTRRELDIVRHMAAGASNTEIAADLHLSEGTVKNHISHILSKMNARDRAHAVRLALEWGLLLE